MAYATPGGLDRTHFMRSIAPYFICFCACALIGCKGKEGIVGEWQGTEPSMQSGTPTEVSVKFESNGNYSLVRGIGQLTSEVDGTYTYDDASKQITMNQQKMLLAGQEVKVTGGNPTGLGRPTPVKWESSSEITITRPVGDIHLKRK